MSQPKQKKQYEKVRISVVAVKSSDIICTSLDSSFTGEEDNLEESHSEN